MYRTDAISSTVSHTAFALHLLRHGSDNNSHLGLKKIQVCYLTDLFLVGYALAALLFTGWGIFRVPFLNSPIWAGSDSFPS